MYIKSVGLSPDEILRQTQFKIKSMYVKLRGTFSEVPCRKMICNNQGVPPRWTLILYLAIHRRLAIKDRLAKGGILVDKTYVLCNIRDESLAIFCSHVHI